MKEGHMASESEDVTTTTDTNNTSASQENVVDRIEKILAKRA